MNEGIVVLSLFDGMSGGQIALERAGIKVRKYYASEIDRYAIQITQKNYPNTIQLGDINNWQEWDIDVPDLILAGSPCQGFSNAGLGLNFDDPRSKLFFVFCDILAHYYDKNPSLKYLLENVKMKKQWREVITDRMKVEPELINSALVSAQNRERLYWANWSFPQPEDKHIYLKDIVEYGEVDRLKSYTIDANYFKGGNPRSYFEDGKRQLVFEHQSQKRAMVKVQGAAIRNQVTKRGVEEQLNVRKDEKSNCVVPSYPNKLNGVVIGRQVGRRINNGKRDNYNKSIQPKQRIEVTRTDDKSGTLSTVQKDNLLVFVGMADDIKGHDIVRRIDSPNGKSPTLTNMQGGHRQPKVALDEYHYRKLTPLECERLQTLEDDGTRYGLDFRFQQMYNSRNERNKPCQTSARCQNVINPLQAKKLNYAINTTIDSLGMEQRKLLGNLSIRAKSVNGMVVNGTNKQLSVIVSSTIKDGKKKTIQTPKNARFVISQSETGHVECVLLTTQDGLELETLRLTYQENMNLTEIQTEDITRMKAVNFFIELLLKENSEENLKVGKLYIMLTLINLIIATAIFLSVKTTHITYLSIGNLNKLQENSFEMELSSLEMGNIIEMSNTSRYRCLGNGWTIDVIAHILSHMNKEQSL